MRYSLLIFLFFTVCIIPGCSGDPEPNRIDIKNFELDGSLNDKYIFRNEIQTEKKKKERYKTNQFEK